MNRIPRLFLLTALFVAALLLAGCDTDDTTAAVPGAAAERYEGTEGEIIKQYLAASAAQQERMRGVSMEVEIDARLPRLKKEGRFQALRLISHVGKISYIAQAFTGDKTVKTDVIAKFLSAETQAQEEGKTRNVGITPQNYKFKYKGVSERDGNTVHIVQLSPRKKRVGLFKGELWLDRETYLPVRETGQFVKNPSVFLKKVLFQRDYDIVDGTAVPRQIASTVETRIVGKAEIVVKFSKFNRLESDNNSVTTSAVTPISYPTP